MREITTPYRLAISHSSADVGMARMLDIIARKSGAECFADFHIQGGRNFRQEIVSGIQGADELAILISPHFVNSPWLNYEAGLAEGGDVLIVPLVYRVTPNDYKDLPFMGSRKPIHVDDIHHYVDELRARINTHATSLRRAAELAAQNIRPSTKLRTDKPIDGSGPGAVDWPTRFRRGSNRTNSNER